jgi:hypothetical protein
MAKRSLAGRRATSHRLAGGPEDTPAKAWSQWAIALTSGVIAAAVSLIATGVAAWVAIDSTHASAAENRAKESREARARIYPDFLATVSAREVAADDYQQLSVSAMLTCENPRAPRYIQLPSKAKYDAADSEYRRQRNLLYVYGSDEAWKAAEALDYLQPEPDSAPALIDERGTSYDEKCTPGQHMFPAGLGAYRWSHVDGADQSELQRSKPRNNSEAYASAYTAFQAVFCREVPAVPRTGCSQ